MDLLLDKRTFKALSNETRVRLLKALEVRRHTQSELADSLEVSVPTVKEHLDALVSAGLVERHEEGRKWKYYSLTKKGKNVLHPEEMKILIVLSTFLLSVLGSVLMFVRRFTPVPVKAEVADAQLARTEMVAEAPPVPAPADTSSPWFWVFVVIAGVSLVVLLLLLVRVVLIKRRLGKTLKKSGSI